MSLYIEFADAFTPLVQEKGGALFRRGEVRDLQVDGDVIHAQVRGSNDYYVELDLADGVPEDGACTCPYYQDRGEGCKHMWAAVLAYSSHYRLGDSGTAPNRAADGRTIELRKPAPPTWKKQLGELREATKRLKEARPSHSTGKQIKGRILYLIDPGATDGLSPSLAVRICTADVKRDGALGKTRPRRPDSLEPTQCAEASDRQIVALLKSTNQGYGYGGWGYSGYYDVLYLPPEWWEDLLPTICQTGRAFLMKNAQDVEDRDPLAWDAGERWLLYLEAKRQGEEFVFTGSFRRGEERMALEEPRAIVSGGLLFARGKVSRFDDAGSFAWLTTLRKGGALRVPAEHRDDLLEEMVRLPSLPRLDLPEELKVQEAEVAPKPILKVRASKPTETYNTSLRGELLMDYEGNVVAYDSGESIVYDRANRRILRRDWAAETRFANRLPLLSFREVREYYSEKTTQIIPKGKLPIAVRTLVPEGWRVEAEGKLYRTATRVDVQVTSHIDWFEVNAKVDFGGASVSMPALLASLRKGETLIPLDDGGMGMLPEEWIRKYALLATGTADGDSIKFKPNQAGLLDALLASQPEATCDELFERTRRELRSFEGVKPQDPPETFTGTLRPYQGEALGWFEFLRKFGFGGCLADDMGLGKTVQVLALLDGRREGSGVEVQGTGGKKPSLAVVPRSLIFNWQQEAAKFAPKLKVLDNSGVTRIKEPAKLAEYDLVLSTYGTMLKDAPLLKDVSFDYVILDEAQAVKNSTTASAKAVRLLQSDHRLALSGTPIQNHLGELWSLFDFLNPGMLGAAAVLSGSALRDPDEETRKTLSRAVRPFILRRTKEQVAKDLPRRLEQTIYCELEADQRKLYNELRDHYRQSLLRTIEEKGLAQSKIQVLEALLRLRQAALHPGLLDKKRQDEPACKLDMLLPRLAEVTEEGHKVLVFSQFTGMLSILRKHLDKDKVVYEYLDGKTRDRQARVDRFQSDDKCTLFLISLKAGGLGLNLTAADYVFLLDPWWNPAVEAQAIDRAHRIGQSRQVFACRLIAKDTVEEKVLALQETKRDLADAIINAENSLIRRLNREDLELLLS